MNELETNCKNKNIRGMRSGINEFMKGYQLRTNLVKNGNGDLFGHVYIIWNRWKNCFCRLLKVHGGPLVPELSPFGVKIATGNWNLSNYGRNNQAESLEFH
jgi:hypothetical protein